MTYLNPKQYFGQKLVLTQWLLTRFGIDPQSEQSDDGRRVPPLIRLTKCFRDVEPGLTADRHHRYLGALLAHRQATWLTTDDQLRGFDANIVRHTDAINRRRREPIHWKYFQWATLLFAEICLYEYFRDREQLRQSLNRQVDRFNAHWQARKYETGIQQYKQAELNKLCLQNATGSGKTLLMHVNVLQFQHYASHFSVRDQYGQVILVSPNERLSEQHRQEMTQSGLANERLAPDGGDLLTGTHRALGRVSVTEITKLHETESAQRMAVDSFGDNNLLLVDEGHRGLGSATRRNQESGWLKTREKLAGCGFIFEYSATFKEAVVAANEKTIEAAYAKNILFDYSYRYFYADGYGKDYRIFNLPSTAQQQEHAYLCAALLAFYQQLKLSKNKGDVWQAFNLARPLWVFVGASVVKDDGKKEAGKRYDEPASDVANIINFLAWFLSHADEAKAIIESLPGRSRRQVWPARRARPKYFLRRVQLLEKPFD